MVSTRIAFIDFVPSINLYNRQTITFNGFLSSLILLSFFSLYFYSSICWGRSNFLFFFFNTKLCLFEISPKPWLFWKLSAQNIHKFHFGIWFSIFFVKANQKEKIKMNLYVWPLDILVYIGNLSKCTSSECIRWSETRSHTANDHWYWIYWVLLNRSISMYSIIIIKFCNVALEQLCTICDSWEVRAAWLHNNETRKIFYEESRNNYCIICWLNAKSKVDSVSFQGVQQGIKH